MPRARAFSLSSDGRIHVVTKKDVPVLRTTEGIWSVSHASLILVP